MNKLSTIFVVILSVAVGAMIPPSTTVERQFMPVNLTMLVGSMGLGRLVVWI